MAIVLESVAYHTRLLRCAPCGFHERWRLWAPRGRPAGMAMMFLQT